MNRKFDFSLSYFLQNATASKVLSVTVAVFLWFFVVYAIDNEDVKTITGVPVTIDQTSLNILNLSVIEGGDATVTLEVSGKRYDIGNLTENDIQVRAVLGVVKGAGNYELSIEPVVPVNAPYSVQIKGERSIWVTFDKQVTKEVDITADIDGLSVPDGYILGAVEVSPKTLTLRGPERDISKIVKAVVRTEFSTPITTSQTIPALITYLDRDGEAVATTHILSNYTTADIIIPVKKNVELPLSFSYTNIPKGINVSSLRHTISNESILVAAPEDEIKNLYEFVIGNINFENLDLEKNSVYTFPVNLPEGFVNVNNIETVVVEFENTGFSSIYLNLNNFSITNIPPGFEAVSATPAINYVRIVGTASALYNIKASDFIIEINLSDRDVQLGQYEMPVSIYAPEKGLTWAVGSYSAVVNVTEK